MKKLEKINKSNNFKSHILYQNYLFKKMLFAVLTIHIHNFNGNLFM